MFSLFGSESIAAFSTAKIIIFTQMFELHGLLPWYKFFTDRILFQGVAHRHLPKWFFLPVTLN